MTPRSATKTLLVLALALPVVQAVLWWVGGLLTSMGDTAGAAIVRHVGTACQVVWAVSLVGLVIVLGLAALNERPPEGE
ncbi:MAG: hypothetical protein WD669_02935 [Pirellulales bacterium]